MNIENYKYKLFGRVKGRKKINNNILKDLKRFTINTSNKIKNDEYNILDIGSGSGENSIHLANKNSKAKIIACEIFEAGNINLSQNILKNKLNNIAIYEGNILQFLDEINQVEIFNEIWILFPDPWPKTRHNKRRLINMLFLKKIYPFLKKSGQLMIASDSKEYIRSVLGTIIASQNIFLWENQTYDTWDYQNLNLPETKFYRKAIEFQRNPMFFKLNKI
jgi:tRNA (guanine-N7-)-methyltransferase